MSFESFSEFLYMGGHWAEVWSAYVIGLIVVLANFMRPRLARRRFFSREGRRSARDTHHPRATHASSSS